MSIALKVFEVFHDLYIKLAFDLSPITQERSMFLVSPAWGCGLCILLNLLSDTLHFAFQKRGGEIQVSLYNPSLAQRFLHFGHTKILFTRNEEGAAQTTVGFTYVLSQEAKLYACMTLCFGIAGIGMRVGTLKGRMLLIKGKG